MQDERPFHQIVCANCLGFLEFVPSGLSFNLTHTVCTVGLKYLCMELATYLGKVSMYPPYTPLPWGDPRPTRAKSQRRPTFIWKIRGLWSRGLLYHRPRESKVVFNTRTSDDSVSNGLIRGCQWRERESAWRRRRMQKIDIQ